MNMYWHELRSLRRPTTGWTLAMLTLAAIYLSIYPEIVQDVSIVREIFSAYPASVRAILGISLDAIATLLGFYAMIFNIITLCGAIQAMIFGTAILTRETRERTADFLLVKPVSRRTIVTAKLLAAITMLLVTDLLYYAGVTLLANRVAAAGYDHQLFLLINVTLLFIQLIFLAIGMAVSVVIPRLKSVLPVSLGIVIGLFFIGALIATGNDDTARFLSPFKYFDPFYIIEHASYERPFLLTGAGIVLAAVAASYYLYLRKDIHAVS